MFTNKILGSNVDTLLTDRKLSIPLNNVLTATVLSVLCTYTISLMRVAASA